NIGELTSAIGDTLTLSGTTLTSNAFTGVGFNTGAVIGDGSQTLNLTTQNVTLDTTRDFIASGIGFDQIGTVTNVGTLTGTTAGDNFTLSGTTATVGSVVGTSFQNVNTINGSGGSDTVDISGQNIDLAVGLITNGVNLISLETINNIGALTAATNDVLAFNSSSISSSSQSGVVFNANNVLGDGSQTLNLDSSTVDLTSTRDFNVGTVAFEQIANVNNTGTVTATNGSENFVINGNSLVVDTVAGTTFNDVGNLLAGAGTDTVDINFGNATLTGTALNVGSSVLVTGIENVSNTGILAGSAGDNTFVETDANQVAVQSIQFSEVSSINGSGGNNSVNVINSGVTLGGSSFTSGNSITYTNVTTATQVGALTGSAGNDSFDETANNQIDTNGFAFQGVSTVNGNGGTDSLSVRAGSSASLNTADFTVSGITYTNIDTVDGVTFVSDGVNGNRSYSLTNNDLNILGSTFNNITTLTAGTGTDALNINNQDLDLTVGLQVSGVTFSGIETVDNIGELTSANSDTLTLSGTTLTSNAFAGVGFNTGVVIGDGSQTVNLDSQTVALTSNRDFNVGSIEFDQIGTVNNAGTLTGTSTGEIYTVSGSSVAVNTVSGTAFNNVSTVDGGLGQDTVDASGSDITLTASSFTNAAGLVFTSIENVENGSGNLIGTTGDDTFSETGSREVTSNGIIYGDITFVDGVSGSDTVDLANNSTVTLDSVNSLRFSGSSQINYDNVERVTNTRNLIGSSGDDNFTVVDRNNQGTTETVVRLDLLDGSGNTIDFIGVRDIDAGDTDINGDGIIDAGLDTINLLDGAIDGNRSTISELADGDISITGFERVNQSGGIALGSNGIDSFTVELNLDGSIDVVISLFDDTGTTVTSTTTILNASSIDGLGQTGSGDSILVGSGSTRSTLDPVLLETAGFRIFSTPGDLTSGLDVFNVEVVQNSGNVSSFASFDFAVTGASEGSASGVLFQDVGSVTGFTGSSLSLLSSALLGSASITSDLIEFTGFESISGASTIEVASGEQGQFSLVQGQMGALQTQLGGDSITFSGVSSVLNTGSLIGSSASDSFVLSGNNSLASAGISFEGVIGLDGGAGSDSISLSQAGAVLDARADVDFISSQISVFNVENITGTGVLTGSSLSESFSSVQSQQVSLGSISFNGVSRLIGSGGTDTLDINNASIALGSSVDAVDFTSRDIGVSGVEVVQRVTDITGSGEIEIFDITAADELSITTAANASLTVVGGGVVNAGASADDVVVNSLGDDIVLITGNSISVGGFTFTSIEQVQAAGTIVGTTLADQFEDFGNNEIGAFNIQFFGTNQVNGLGGADQFISNGSVLVFNGGTGNDALISDTNVELTNITNGADGVSGNTSFTGVEQFFGNETATFTGSDQNTLVGITGLNNGSLQVDGGSSVTFTGFGIIRTGSGTDTANFSASGALTSLDLGAGDDVINLTATSTASLIGGAGNDTLQLDNSNNIVDVTGVNSGDVNGNTFAGIENIITGSGADQVSVSGSLVNISTGAGNDSLQFTGSGSVSGLINAGTGSDSLVGGGAFQITNINANAVVIGELNGSAFEGVENFVAEGEATLAGSNQDLTFNLNSNGVLGVNLTGAGNQVFEVTGFSGLQAGSGFNNLITNGESSPFTITNGNSSFGGFAFSGIDFIEDNTGLVDISTPLAVSFSDTGLLNIGNNIQFDFNNAPLTISGAASVSGSLFAQSTISLMDITGDITLSGDFIDITATTIDGAVSIQDDNDIVITNISTAGGNVSVGAASGNIFLNTINTGSTSSGEVNLNASVSILIDPLIDFGENPDRIVNLTSASATLIANDIIGSENTPFRTNVFSFSSFSEEFVPVNNSLAGTIPRQSGFRISSIAERAATSGASVAAAQTGLEEIGNVDPAIFAELKPYAVGSSPLLLPEDQREDEFEENLDEEFVDYNESDTVSQK
ncbi:beta strand repeat-containing protein, partial [Sessilibacter sp. MAH1]